MSTNLHPVDWSGDKVGIFHDNVDKLITTGKKSNNYFSYQSGYALIKLFNKLCNFRNKEILDYGCGPGFFINLILNKYKAKKVYGYDISEESVRLCENQNDGYENWGGYGRIVRVIQFSMVKNLT